MGYGSTHISERGILEQRRVQRSEGGPERSSPTPPSPQLSGDRATPQVSPPAPSPALLSLTWAGPCTSLGLNVPLEGLRLQHAWLYSWTTWGGGSGSMEGSPPQNGFPLLRCLHSHLPREGTLATHNLTIKSATTCPVGPMGLFSHSMYHLEHRRCSKNIHERKGWLTLPPGRQVTSQALQLTQPLPARAQGLGPGPHLLTCGFPTNLRISLWAFHSSTHLVPGLQRGWEYSLLGLRLDGETDAGHTMLPGSGRAL